MLATTNNIARCLLGGHILNWVQSIHSSGMGQESFATSLQVGFLCTAISFGPRHRQLVDVPNYHSLYINGRCPRVPYWYGVAIHWWELCHVWLDTIYILYFLVLGHHSSFSICGPSLYGTKVFGHAVQGNQPRLVYFLGGLCRVVSCRFADVQRFLSWVRVPIRYCIVEFCWILFICGGFSVRPCSCHFVSQSAVEISVLRPCFSIHSMNSVIHLAIICISSAPRIIWLL